MNFYSQHLNKNFTQKKALKMNLVVVRPVEKHANNSAMVSAIHVAEKTVRCLRPSVLLVVKRLQYHSSLPVTDLFIAETVSKLEGTVATDKLLK